MDISNKNAQDEVRRVMDFLLENRGRKIILGQHTQTMEQAELSYIREVTGELPALCGFELLAYSPNIRYRECGEECLKEVYEAEHTLKKAWEWAKMGGLITFTWHWFSPLFGRDKSFFTDNTDFSAELAATSGTPEYHALLSDMDYMAGLLKPFCDAHIPILWRPFHENEGHWFWWGNCKKDVVKKLYRLMYDRYVNHFKLNNLIWVFNSTNPECYPGDDIMDIISRDLYPEAHCHTDHSRELSELSAITKAEKLYAIAEIGTIPDVEAVVENHIPWSYYMTWSNEFGKTDHFTSKEELKKAYSYEHSVTLSRLPELYSVR